MRIYVIRHGQAVGNAEGRFLGHVDPPLTAEGQAQARRMAAALVDRGITHIQASDLTRAFATAQAVGDRLGLPVVRNPALREVNHGVLDGLTATEVRASPYGQAREMDKYGYAPPAGESYRQIEARLLPVVSGAPDGCLLVTHLGPMRVLLHCLCGYDEIAATEAKIGHERVLVLERSGTGWQGTLTDASPARQS